MISLEYLSADVLPIILGLFFRISRYRVEKKGVILIYSNGLKYPPIPTISQLPTVLP